jgi:trehalose 6-phosphate phosphatase
MMSAYSPASDAKSAARMTNLPPPPRAAPPMPAIASAALLLDLDGTLLDIAPTPGAVIVPPGLINALLAWRARLNGALAIVSGRPIEQIDELLPDVPTAIAGEHGGAIRHRPEGPIERPFLPALPAHWLDAATEIAATHPGALLEPKQRGFVLHYRASPAAGPSLGAALRALLTPHAEFFALIPARMAWEVRPQGIDKGTAVRRLMERPPFAGRLPVFIGDDVTDEDGIAAANALGGVGLMVPDAFGDPAGVRAWLS